MSIPDVHQQSDRDLLVRIDERLNSVMKDLAAERSDSITRSAKHEFDLEKLRVEVKIENDKRIAETESLRMSRAQLYGAAFAISAIVSALIQKFWK